MTEARVLADALVEAGILRGGDEKAGPYYMNYIEPCTAKQAITDWRVAGEVLEKMPEHLLAGLIEDAVIYQQFDWLKDPRSIIKEWYAARETER